jgi:protein TonB
MRAPATPADDAVTPLAEHANADPDGGDPEGAEGGDPGGLPGGVPGGVVGGVPGGVLGGVIGGTGSGPVPVARPDRPPKPIHLPRPVYPHEAFVDKVEGTVLLEIVIDERGHVVRARVLRSVPRLDAAALEAVRSWLFVPALHQGHPVASLALAPVSFSIY